MILTFDDINSDSVLKKVKEQDPVEATNNYLALADAYYQSRILRRFGLTDLTAQNPPSALVLQVVELKVALQVATDNVGLNVTAVTEYSFNDIWKARMKSSGEQLKMAEDNLLLSDVALVEPDDDVPMESKTGFKAVNRYG